MTVCVLSLLDLPQEAAPVIPSQPRFLICEMGMLRRRVALFWAPTLRAQGGNKQSPTGTRNLDGSNPLLSTVGR